MSFAHPGLPPIVIEAKTSYDGRLPEARHLLHLIFRFCERFESKIVNDHLN